MLGFIKYWLDQKRMLRRQMQQLQYSRWERRNIPAFSRRRTRWSMVKTL